MAAAAAALLGCPAGASADTVVVDGIEGMGRVTAFRGAVAWVADHRGQSGRVHVLNRGSRRVVRIRSLHPHFAQGIDFGTDRRGRTVLTYHRCREVFPRNSPPRNVACDAFAYTLATGREQRLRRASTRECKESEPTMWRGTVVVRRSRERRGCRRGLWVIPARGEPRRLTTRFPDDVDVRGSHVLADFGGDLFVFRPSGRQTIELFSLSSRSRKVLADYDDMLDGPRIATPVLDGGFAHWHVTDGLDDRCLEEIVRAGVRERRPVPRALAPARTVLVTEDGGGFAVDGGRVLYTGSPPGSGPDAEAAAILRADEPPAAFTADEPFGGPCPDG